MTDNNVVNMPTPKHLLVQRYRAAVERTKHGRSEWIQGQIDQALILHEARDQFGDDNNAFGRWIAENELDYLSRDDRASMIWLVEAADGNRDNLCFMFDTIADEQWSPTTLKRMVLDKRLSFIRAVGDAIGGNKGLSIESNTPESISPTSESPSTPSTVAVSRPMPVKDHTQHKNPATKGRKPALVEMHGDTGEAVLDWIRSLLAGKPLSYSMLSRALVKLKTNTLKQMLAFIEAHRDGLRPALNAETFSAAIFWKDIPFELSKDISGHLIKPDQIIGKVIADWDVRIAPVMRDWITDGAPENTREWYELRDRKPVPMAAPVITAELRTEAVAVGIDMDDPRFSSLPEQSIRQIINNKTRSREYANEHGLFKLPEHPTAIRVFGRDIWPCPPQQHWTWRDAFYAYHLWLEADTHLQVYEKRANVRGRTLMNPFVPILTNINGAVGAAFKEMVWAQFHDDAKESDTFGPPKMLLFQGE